MQFQVREAQKEKEKWKKQNKELRELKKQALQQQLLATY